MQHILENWLLVKNTRKEQCKSKQHKTNPTDHQNKHKETKKANQNKTINKPSKSSESNNKPKEQHKQARTNKT